MNKLDAQRQQEIQQAEELLFAGPQALGFAKGLFQGHFVSDWVMPYPRIPEAEQGQLDQTLTELRKFLNEDLDPAEIDGQADIPRSVIDGLGRIGVLGMASPVTGHHSKEPEWPLVGLRPPALRQVFRRLRAIVILADFC